MPSVELSADGCTQCVRAKIMVAQLYDVYHSATHVCLRLQCGGTQDLYHRLMTRESVGHGDRSLSCRKVVSIISQCVSAVAHLHVGPRSHIGTLSLPTSYSRSTRSLCTFDCELQFCNTGSAGVTLKLADMSWTMGRDGARLYSVDRPP